MINILKAVRFAENSLNDRSTFQQERGAAWVMPVLLVFVIITAGGCSRKEYRLQADREAYDVIAERNDDPRWHVEDYSIKIDPRSRYYDPNDPSGVWHLLHRMGWSCQKPERRARDEDAIVTWHKRDWPRLKKSPTKR